MATAKYKRGKDGYFATKVWDGTYNTNGTKHLKNVRSKKSSRDLENKVKEMEAEVEARNHIIKTDRSFIDYSRYWLRVYKALKSHNTRAMYENIIEKHFLPLTGVRLQDIDHIHYQLLLNETSGKNRTQEQIELTFKQVLKSAVAEHLFPDNVKEEIFKSMDKVNYTPGEKRPLTESEKKAVFRADFKEMDKIYVYLIYGCGLRREEALALTIFDVNAKKKEVTINKAHEFVGNDPRQKEPKSKNGYRTVPIPQKVFPAVENYVNKRKALGKTYLFVMRNGNPITKSSYDKMWARILARLQEVCEDQITGLTAHVFRHNFCTNLCYQIPKISIKKIAQLMGDTEAMVLKVYNHMILEKEDAEGAVNDAMNL